MSQSLLVKIAGWIAVSCLLSCLAYPGYGQEVPAGPAQSLLEEASQQLGYGDYQAAEAACREVITSYPEYEFAARLVLAEVYRGQGRFDEAIQQAELALAKVRRLYPDDTQRIAGAEGEIKRLREAERIFSERVAQLKATIASEPGPAAVTAQLELGDVLLINGRRQQALAQYEKVIEQYPATVQAVRAAKRLGMIYDTQGKQEQAEAAYLKAASIERGRRFRAEGRPRIAEYQKVIEEQPDSAEAVDAEYRIGYVCALYAEYDQAIAQLTSLIKQHPESTPAVPALDLLEVIFSQPDRHDQGLAVLPGLVDTYYPDNPQMLLKLCQFYRTAAKPDKLIQTAESIAASFPQSAQAAAALLMVCDTYWQAGELDQVETTAQRVIQHYAQRDEVDGAVKKLAAVYEAREGLPAAVAKLRKLAEQYPGTKVAPRVAAIIAQAAAAPQVTLPPQTSPGVVLVFEESGLKGGHADEPEKTHARADH